MRSGRRGAVVLFLVVGLLIGIVAMAMRIVTPGPPSSQVAPRAPMTSRAQAAPLTKRLALVVLDGLRFDVATDGRRMPRLSARFRSNASAELWAEPISMTSSAALVFGTGSHADIDLAIRNESNRPTDYESIFAIARKAGLRTGTVGDKVWTEMYPNAWDVSRHEARQLAIGLSDDEAAFAKARAVQALDPPLDLAVYHFDHPDHMGHGLGIANPAYEVYIESFDRLLAEFLAGFSADTTVIVAGDHGASMSGIHGSDTVEQRRTLVVATGPGITTNAPRMTRVDDMDIAATMAALLGLAAPRYSRGQPVVSWLDVDEQARAAIACANLRDLGRLVEGSGAAAGEATIAPACDEQRTAEARLASALPIARELDTRIGESDTSQSRGFGLSLFAAGVAALLSFVLFFRTAPASTLAGGGVAFAIALAVSVFLTSHLEKLPGAWLTPTRIALYVAFNVPLLLWLLRPVATSARLERSPVLAAVVLPGLLVLTETHSALLESYALSVVLVLFALIRGIPTSAGFPRSWAAAKRGLGARLGFVLPLVILFCVACIDAGNFVPAWLQQAPRAHLAAALVSISAFTAVRHRRLRAPLASVLGFAGIAVVCLLLRRYVPVAVGLSAWGLVTVAAGVAILRKQRAHAELLGLAAYAWVSRDLEIPFLLAGYLVAVAFGEAVAKDLERAPAKGASRVLVSSLISFAFAWGYVQAVAIQAGLHFMHFDFAAGVFRDPGVTMPRIVVALLYKYAVARGFLLFGLLLPLSRPMRLLALRCLVAVFALRATVLVASLEASRGSFWTPIWVTSELPHVLLGLVVVAVAFAVALSRAPGPPHSLGEATAHV